VALTRRGRMAVTIGVVLTLMVAVVVGFVLSGSKNPVTAAINRLTGNSTAPPAPCPLTGVAPRHGKPVPQRPALAVKVENTSAAYPLTGLDHADIVYEELVEGGITRFMAVFQCSSAGRVGPVRSARTTDPKLLVQFERHAILAFSGAQHAVMRVVEQSGVTPFTETSGGPAFSRDAGRAVPHNLFVNAATLWARAGSEEGPPDPVFSFDAAVPERAKRVSTVSLPFSSFSTSTWKWMGSLGHWERQLNGAPMNLEGGTPITATNIVIQSVAVTPSKLVDVLGHPSPEVNVTGSGKAWILRDGKRIAGRWIRHGKHGVTQFQTRDGSVIALSPGNTWVELLPSTAHPVFGR
jgi:hypothetical protein